jgi:hypothetical protein
LFPRKTSGALTQVVHWQAVNQTEPDWDAFLAELS